MANGLKTAGIYTANTNALTNWIFTRDQYPTDHTCYIKLLIRYGNYNDAEGYIFLDPKYYTNTTLDLDGNLMIEIFKTTS